MNMDAYHIPEEDHEFARLHRVSYLIAAFIGDRLTPAEREELDDWVGASQENLSFFEEATDETKLRQSLDWFHRLDMEKARRRILSKMEQSNAARWKFPIPLAVAACVLAITGLVIGMYYFTLRDHRAATALTAEVRGAMLQLADGRTIYLDSMANGRMQAAGHITISRKGTEVSVIDTSEHAVETGINTLVVPRGRQYSLVLADGSRVELNAGSSLQFPAAFNAAERKVILRGEGFFEVAKSKDHPFVVTTGSAAITVLGTQFNVNAYENEGALTTTLVEGKVRINAEGQEATLAPGEQAVLKERALNTFANADINKITAWRHGEFVFRETPLDEILRTLERWYDIEIDNQSRRNEKFNATFNRSWNLEKIIDYLEQTNRVQFSLSGKKLTVKD